MYCSLTTCCAFQTDSKRESNTLPCGPLLIYFVRLALSTDTLQIPYRYPQREGADNGEQRVERMLLWRPPSPLCITLDLVSMHACHPRSVFLRVEQNNVASTGWRMGLRCMYRISRAISPHHARTAVVDRFSKLIIKQKHN